MNTTQISTGNVAGNFKVGDKVSLREFLNYTDGGVGEKPRRVKQVLHRFGDGLFIRNRLEDGKRTWVATKRLTIEVS